MKTVARINVSGLGCIDKRAVVDGMQLQRPSLTALGGWDVASSAGPLALMGLSTLLGGRTSYGKGSRRNNEKVVAIAAVGISGNQIKSRVNAVSVSGVHPKIVYSNQAPLCAFIDKVSMTLELDHFIDTIRQEQIGEVWVFS